MNTKKNKTERKTGLSRSFSVSRYLSDSRISLFFKEWREKLSFKDQVEWSKIYRRYSMCRIRFVTIVRSRGRGLDPVKLV